MGGLRFGKRRRRRWSRRLLVILILAVAGLLAAVWPLWLLPYERFTITQHAPLPSEAAREFTAGVAEVDITPPIGIPKFGYAAWGRSADGFQTRLKARAFYLKPVDAPPVVLVQTDLGSGSLLLRHRITERIARDTDIPHTRLSLLSTHTHSGPGLYFASTFYNVFGANAPGYDPALTDFLVERISQAVITAYQQRRPAKLAAGQIAVNDVTRNRSLPAYRQNPEATDNSNIYNTINPWLTLLRIDLRADDGRYYPAGALSAYSIHGTAVPPFTEPYHADVWAMFERRLAWDIATRYATPWPVVHGTYEGTHGDTTPNWRDGERGAEEADRLGTLLGQQAVTLFHSLDSELTRTVSVQSGMQEIDLLQGDHAPLCKRALVGTATVGAATGDEVFPIAWIPPFEEGWPERHYDSDDCHAEKRTMLGVLQEWGLAAEKMPHRLLIHFLRINQLHLTLLPFEVTTATGARINSAVAAAAGNPDDALFAIGSLANGYMGYATTAEEYALQWYEGGHTLYGPGTEAYLSRLAATVAAATLQGTPPADVPAHHEFSLPVRSYFPPPVVVKGQRAVLEPPHMASAPLRAPFWRVRYRDVAPGNLALHEPLLRVEQLAPNGNWVPLIVDAVAVDDETTQLQIAMVDEAEDGMADYEIAWYNPLRSELPMRIVVAPRAGLPELTIPLVIDDPKP